MGGGENKLTVGGETVLFRHEKTFVNKTGIGLLISDAMDDGEVSRRIKQFNSLKYEWIGLILRAEMIAIKNESGDVGKFAALAKRVMDESDAIPVLMSDNVDALKAALAVAATEQNYAAMAGLAKEFKCPLAAKSDNLNSLSELTDKIVAAGVKDIVLDSGARTVRKIFEDMTFLRRAALVQKNRSLGFSPIAFPGEMTADPLKETIIASLLIAKYAGIVILSDFQGESLFPLLVERLNIFTDPQRPMMMKEGIYPIGNPTEDSPVTITTNFALTYFIVSGEIEASRVPTWLLVMETEGLSVLTAWAAGKFVGDAMGIFVKKCGILDKIKHRKIIIPGYVAAVSGDLEEELGPDWEVKIGPREAAHLSAFLKLEIAG
jgi:acetyl-CoA decarbonylase/synthase complex subunit gamma